MIIIFWEMTPCGSYKSVISQKMIIIIVTAVETSNLTFFDFDRFFQFLDTLHSR
jgi:hypothetical protein